jgi:hypothetical protein
MRIDPTATIPMERYEELIHIEKKMKTICDGLSKVVIYSENYSKFIYTNDKAINIMANDLKLKSSLVDQYLYKIKDYKKMEEEFNQIKKTWLYKIFNMFNF